MKKSIFIAGIALCMIAGVGTYTMVSRTATSSMSNLTKANLEAMADSESGHINDSFPQSGTKVILHKVYDNKGKLIDTWEEHIPYICCIYSPGSTCNPMNC